MSKAMYLLVSSAAHTFVHVTIAQKTRLVELLRQEEVRISEFSVSNGYVYL